MAETKIEYLRLEPATNGFILSWNERTEKSSAGKNTFDNCSYREMKEVYDIDDNDDNAEEVFNRFKELAMKQYKQLNSK